MSREVVANINIWNVYQATGPRIELTTTSRLAQFPKQDCWEATSLAICL